jgi:hypothetical protein
MLLLCRLRQPLPHHSSLSTRPPNHLHLLSPQQQLKQQQQRWTPLG